jgi:hypothetical protein
MRWHLVDGGLTPCQSVRLHPILTLTGSMFILVKYYPRWLPGGGFQDWARRAKDLFDEFTLKPFNEARDRAADPALNFPSFIRQHSEKLNNSDSAGKAVVAGTAASLYSGMNSFPRDSIEH